MESGAGAATSEEADAAAPPREEGFASTPSSGLPVRFLGRYVLWGALIYVLLCLSGLYANAKLLWRFDVPYLRYVGLSDFLTGIASFGNVAFTPSFVLTVIGFGLAAAAGTAATTVFRYKSRSQSDPPEGELAQQPDAAVDGLPLRVWLDAGWVRRTPLVALALTGVAGLVGISVSVSAEERRLLAMASSFDDGMAAPTTPDVVSVRTDEQSWDHLLNLRSSSHYEFYYDLSTKQPVVLARDRISLVVASSPRPSERQVAGGASPDGDETADALESRTSGIAAISTAQPVRVAAAAATATDVDGPIVGPAEAEPARRQSIDMSTEADGAAVVTIAPPGLRKASLDGNPDGAIGPSAASEVAEATAAPVVRLAQATSTPAAQSEGGATVRRPVAGPVGSSQAPRQALAEDLASMEGGVQQSRGSLDGLKEHLQRVETTFDEMRRFVDDLEGALAGIDRAFTGLEEHLAETGAVVAHADCPELVLPQPLRFVPGETSLTLESVGLLFQARRRLVADRSADRNEWLVVESHWDGGTTAAADESEAIERAEAVRSFLYSELGLPEQTIATVPIRSAAPAATIRLFDCARRPASQTAAPASPRIGVVATAAAGELSSDGSVRPAAFEEKPASEEDPASLAQTPVPAERTQAALQQTPNPAEQTRASVEPTPASANRAPAAVEPTMPAPRLETRETDRGLLLSVPGLFDSDRIQLGSVGRELLDQVGEILVEQRGHDVAVIGHTDDVGDADYNMTLSHQRATEVRDYLLQEFPLDASRLRVAGWGEAVPVASNATAEGRAANRRIEVMIFD